MPADLTPCSKYTQRVVKDLLDESKGTMVLVRVSTLAQGDELVDQLKNMQQTTASIPLCDLEVGQQSN